jgi:hypothetical protein
MGAAAGELGTSFSGLTVAGFRNRYDDDADGDDLYIDCSKIENGGFFVRRRTK